jgi:hypothetical protein
MDDRNSKAYWLLGLAAAAGLVLAASLLYQRGQAADPIGRANDLIARCSHKIAEIEDSLEHLQATVQPAA